MNRTLLVMALSLGWVVPGTAQSPDAAVPERRGASPAEIRAGIISQSVRRQSALEGAGLAQGSGTVRGLELQARFDVFGILLRRGSGSLGGDGHGLSGDFLTQEARVMLGAPAFSAEVGMLERTSSHLNETPQARLWRAGLRSQWGIGGSGVVMGVAVGALFSRIDQPGSASFQNAGHDLTADVLLQAPGGLPLYALVGWRHQRFDDLESEAPRWEEASGPYFGLGFRLARRPVMR